MMKLVPAMQRPGCRPFLAGAGTANAQALSQWWSWNVSGREGQSCTFSSLMKPKKRGQRHAESSTHWCCQPAVKGKLYGSHNQKVLENFKPRSDKMLLMFPKDHCRCGVQDGVQGTRVDRRGRQVRGDCCRSRPEVMVAESKCHREELGDFAVQIGCRMNKACWWNTSKGC